MGNNKTYDGKPLCMGISGFNHYETERADAPKYPPAVLTPTDILDMLHEVIELCKDPRISYAVKLLEDHIAKTDNPHHTQLNQFTEDVAEVLWKEFVSRTGSTLTLEEFKKALFNLIHIASPSEAETGTVENAVVSVFDARSLIDTHNTDPEAHADLFKKITPGSPIIEDPGYSFYPQYGFNEYIMQPMDLQLSKDDEAKMTEVPYTYTGSDGFVYKVDEDILPVDWSYGRPLIPCFGVRINKYLNSTGISSFTLSNVCIIPDAETAPDKSITATAIYQENDDTPNIRKIVYPNFTLERKKPVTVSIYVKPESQSMFVISFEDVLNSGIETRAVFDLKRNASIMTNHFNRYNCTLQKLSDGWYRCGFSMYNPTGRISDLNMYFVNDQSLDDVEHWTWEVDGTGAICGYVWGVQFENGFQMSPYIPTTDKPGIRKPIVVHIPLRADWYKPECNTLHIDYQMHETDPSMTAKEYRPVLVMKNNNSKAMVMKHQNGTCIITRYFTSTVDTNYDFGTFQDKVPLPKNTDMIQVTHGISPTEIITCINNGRVYHSKPVLMNKATDLYLGTDMEGSYYNGYISDISIYPILVTDAEVQFLNGETYE